MPVSTASIRIRRPFAALVPWLAIATALAPAVAPTARADAPGLADRWMDPSAARIGLHTVLVVGISKDEAARRRFEDRVVGVLRAQHTEGVTSYSIVPDLQAPRDPKQVMDALFSKRVDGVITVRLKPLDGKAEEAWAAGWRAAQEEAQRVRDYVTEALAETNPEASDFGVEVTLWAMGAAQPGRRIWAGRFPRESIKFLRKHSYEMVPMVINEMQYKDLF